MIPFLQTAGEPLLVYYVLNPISEIFYFGILSGVMFMYLKDNVPNRLDVFIGKRVGNVLKLHTHKTPSDKKKDMTYKGGMYVLENADIKLEMKHGLFYRPVHIFDEDNLTDIKTTHKNEEDKENKQTIGKPTIKTITKKVKDKDGNETVTEETITIPPKEITTTIKGKQFPIDVDIDSVFTISSVKVYNWLKNRMIETTWKAIIKQAIGSDLMMTLLYLGLGTIIGGFGVYSVVPSHAVPYQVITTITHTINGTTTH